MLSIIIPAYNEEKYITRCLQSAFALCNESYPAEVIVVNNASTDRTCEIVKKGFPQARLFNEPRKGLTIAYNRGAKEARGDILLFVDADVVLPRNHLAKISREFEKSPDLVALSGPYVYKDGGIVRELVIRFVYLFFAMPAEFILNRALNLSASVASGNTAVRKETFDKIGGFNENIFYGLETDIALRLKKVGKVRFRHYFWVESSARRLKGEGTLLVLFRHALNIIWPSLFGRPFTKDYTDIR